MVKMWQQIVFSLKRCMIYLKITVKQINNSQHLRTYFGVILINHTIQLIVNK